MDDEARERIKQLILNDADAGPGYFVIRNATSENPSIESAPCQVPGCVATAVRSRNDELLLCQEHYDEGGYGSA